MNWDNTFGTVFKRKFHCMIPVVLICGSIILYLVRRKLYQLLPEIYIMAV
jgi:hypothetical protein